MFYITGIIYNNYNSNKLLAGKFISAQYMPEKSIFNQSQCSIVLVYFTMVIILINCLPKKFIVVNKIVDVSKEYVFFSNILPKCFVLFVAFVMFYWGKMGSTPFFQLVNFSALGALSYGSSAPKCRLYLAVANYFQSMLQCIVIKLLRLNSWICRF